MKYPSRTNQELLEEISVLKQKNKELEKSGSERKQVENALRESEANFRRSLDESPLGMRIVTAEGETLYANRAILDIYGYDSIEELKTTPVKKRYTPQSYAEFRIRRKKRRQGDDNPSEYEISIVRKGGEIRHLQVLRKAIPWDGERQFQVIYQDITERKRVAEALSGSEKRYHKLFESMISGFALHEVILDEGGKHSDYRFLDVNPAFEQLTGWKAADLIGRNVLDVMPDSEDFWTETYGRVAGTGETFHFENYSKKLDKYFEVTVYEPEPGRYASIFQDISDRKRAEERLQHADKLDALGTLAGGIAHDFNNLLMGIQGYASLTLLDLDPSHPHYERIKRIEEQVQSGVDLTRQLLGFARGGRYEVKPTDMNDVLEKSSSMFGRTKKEISIHRKYAKDLWSVEVDRGQMEQVFMNLYVNAWQAMPGGGEIYLETEKIILDDEQALSCAVKPGRYIKISMTDTGTGMDEKTRERIFDPFFTTKEMGRGTGLGMATVYRIIKGHGGMINVDSEPGHGTMFTIYLPASEKEVVKEKTATGTIARGTETILLVDDEKMVMEVSKELLESMGYLVYAAGSGQEAIAVYMEKRNEIDLVILDMIMPGISGGETFDRLREIDPEIRVLLSSGYSLTGKAQTIMDRGCNGFLQKPFHPEKFSSKVREMLD